MAESKEFTAARLFGLEREPRTSISTPDAVVIVAERDGSKRCALAIYQEGPFTEHAFYAWLTAKQREAIAAALAPVATETTEQESGKSA
jgi:hypothetical protein